MAHSTTINPGSGGNTFRDFDPVTGAPYPTTGRVQAFYLTTSVDTNTAPTTVTGGNPLYTGTGTPPFTSLSAVAATGAGTALVMTTARGTIGVQVTTTGSPASVSVTLQGSLDGSTWTNVGSAITGTGTTLTFFTGSPCTQFRLNLGTLTGGTAPTVTGILCAD